MTLQVGYEIAQLALIGLSLTTVIFGPLRDGFMGAGIGIASYIVAVTDIVWNSPLAVSM